MIEVLFHSFCQGTGEFGMMGRQGNDQEKLLYSFGHGGETTLVPSVTSLFSKHTSIHLWVFQRNKLKADIANHKYIFILDAWNTNRLYDKIASFSSRRPDLGLLWAYTLFLRCFHRVAVHGVECTGDDDPGAW